MQSTSGHIYDTDIRRDIEGGYCQTLKIKNYPLRFSFLPIESKARGRILAGSHSWFRVFSIIVRYAWFNILHTEPDADNECYAECFAADCN
jgi:hypothetical protein